MTSHESYVRRPRSDAPITGDRLNRRMRLSSVSMGTTTAVGELVGRGAPDVTWESLPARFRERGLRWTPQRRLLVSVLAATDGHITGSELVERCRAVDPGTIPSTVYRTLDVFEEMGLIRHAHGVDGREEYHVLPATDHGHLHCMGCGRSWELASSDVKVLTDRLRRSQGFEVDLSHVSVSGRCQECMEVAGAG
jgi:Fur family transcriptional regulator, ferric uptake regulator